MKLSRFLLFSCILLVMTAFPLFDSKSENPVVTSKQTSAPEITSEDHAFCTYPDDRDTFIDDVDFSNFKHE